MKSFSIQVLIKFTLAIKSLNQLESGFKVEYDYFIQLGGMALLRKAKYISSNS